MMNKRQSRRNIIVTCAVNAGQELIKTTLDILHPESSDDEVDQIIEEANLFEAQIRLDNRGCCEVRNKVYVNEIIPRFNEEVFRQHFRMTRTTYENLERRLAPKLMRIGTEGRPMIPVRDQLLSVIWLLATPDSFRSVADRFNMGKSILHDSFYRVVNALNSIADSVIVWPENDRLTVVKERFNKIGVLPDVIGAIDGTHIPILAPHLNSESYRTRKCEYALTLQAVCDADLVFTDCFVGFAGSVNDSRVFRNSDLWICVQEDRAKFFPQNEYIIGDKAYPVLSWCIPPYINKGNLTEVQVNFNMQLSRMRQVVERAFALLKGRFQRLKYLHMSLAHFIPSMILSCCVLHNLCLAYNDNVDDFIEEGRQYDERSSAEQNQNQRPADELREMIYNDAQGPAKRNYLAALIS